MAASANTVTAHLRRRSIVSVPIPTAREGTDDTSTGHARFPSYSGAGQLHRSNPWSIPRSGYWRRPSANFTLGAFLIIFVVLWQLSLSADGISTVKKISQESLKSILGPPGIPDHLAYRRHLEVFHSPYNLSESRTLGFDSIYVLSLPSAAERQQQMHKIARALGLEFEIHNATAKNLPVIGWIAERAKEVKDLKRPVLAKVLGKPEHEVGGMGAESIWFQDEDAERGFLFPEQNDKRWRIGDRRVSWTDYLARTPNHHLKSATTEEQIKDILWDPVEPAAFRQLTSAVLACWYSHTTMWQKMLSRGQKSALFLEDDVDIEWDIGRLWPNALRVLPRNWDMVFLGHCWGRTRSKPMYLNPTVRKAAEPRCLHAYALSHSGAKRLLELVNSPWIAYQLAIDLIVAKFVKEGKLKAFVLEPPLINQSKDGPSSIQPGTGNAWKGLLMDSTLDRIWRDEGLEVPAPTWEDTKDDPSIWNS